MGTPEVAGAGDDGEARADGGADHDPAVLARAMVPDLRQAALPLLVGGVLPLVGYALLRPHVSSDAVGLLAVAVLPLGEVLWSRRRHGGLEPIGVLTLVGLALGVVGALVTRGDPTLLKLRESVFTGVFGVACLASLGARRPLMFHIGRAFATGGDASRAVAFETLWENPGAPGRFRRTTALWGLGLVGEAVVRTVLVFTVSTTLLLALAPLLFWTVLGSLIVLSVRAIRAGTAAAEAAQTVGP